MEIENKTSEKILKILVKEPFTDHTATSLAKILGVTRQGLWKTLNKLSKDKLISLKSIADTKKSAVKIDIELKNPLTIKTLSLLLTKESLNYERWRSNFAELERYSDFIVLFGSMLRNPKGASDIDLLAVMDKKNFKPVNEIKSKIQKTQAKEIHLIDLTKEEFVKELKKQNRAYLGALKEGIILFGQDNFLKFMEELKS
ncbi:MAG: HTH domain-containing protein [Nanoarchaeota archaeon]|nr:HTH domain-containing protein [Nanoarchaeota archaeon]